MEEEGWELCSVPCDQPTYGHMTCRCRPAHSASTVVSGSHGAGTPNQQGSAPGLRLISSTALRCQVVSVVIAMITGVTLDFTPLDRSESASANRADPRRCDRMRLDSHLWTKQ